MQCDVIPKRCGCCIKKRTILIVVVTLLLITRPIGETDWGEWPKCLECTSVLKKTCFVLYCQVYQYTSWHMWPLQATSCEAFVVKQLTNLPQSIKT
jgi:hypothetical protein